MADMVFTTVGAIFTSKMPYFLQLFSFFVSHSNFMSMHTDWSRKTSLYLVIVVTFLNVMTNMVIEVHYYRNRGKSNVLSHEILGENSLCWSPSGGLMGIFRINGIYLLHVLLYASEYDRIIGFLWIFISSDLTIYSPRLSWAIYEPFINPTLGQTNSRQLLDNITTFPSLIWLNHTYHSVLRSRMITWQNYIDISVINGVKLFRAEAGASLAGIWCNTLGLFRNFMTCMFNTPDGHNYHTINAVNVVLIWVVR